MVKTRPVFQKNYFPEHGMRYLDTAHPTSERPHHVLSTQRNSNGLRHAHRTEDCPFPGPGQGPSWVIATLTTHYYLDILAKEAGMEAKPVG